MFFFHETEEGVWCLFDIMMLKRCICYISQLIKTVRVQSCLVILQWWPPLPPRLQLAHFLVAVELLMDWFGGRFNWASQLLAGRLPPLFLKQCCIVNSPIRGGISPQMVHQTMLWGPSMIFDNTLIFKAKLYSLLLFMPPSWMATFRVLFLSFMFGISRTPEGKLWFLSPFLFESSQGEIETSPLLPK